MTRRLAIGDPHGRPAVLARLLQRVGVVDESMRWTGGTDEVWVLGDHVDRGPDGIGVIDLLMRLQSEAAMDGGKVGTVLGNHDAMLVSASRFPNRSSGGAGGTFLLDWLANGGKQSDLDRLGLGHAYWLISQPAVARSGDVLFVHADALFYLRYGKSVPDANAAILKLLESDDLKAWDRFLGEFAARRELEKPRAAKRLLDAYGGRVIVHGHTPIPYLTGQPPEEVTGPLVYCDGMCVNVDGGIYGGGQGFVLDCSDEAMGDPA